MEALTQRQIKALKVLAMGTPVIAPWNHRDLAPMQPRLVRGQSANQANGRLSSNTVWTITDEGRRFLENERAGQ